MRDRLRILTVEDEPAIAELLALLLGGPAAKITNAADGWMALMKIGAAGNRSTSLLPTITCGV